MKPFISIVCVTVLLFNLFGFYFSFYINRNQVKQQNRAAIAMVQKGIQQLQFTKAQYAALQKPEENEFVLNGESYDVKDVSVHGNMVIVHARLDKEENDLVQRFAKWMENENTERHSPNGATALKYFQLEFYWNHTSLISFNNSGLVAVPQYKAKACVSPVLSFLTPPPDFSRA